MIQFGMPTLIENHISIVPENELDHFSCWSVKENAREFAGVVIKPDQ